MSGRLWFVLQESLRSATQAIQSNLFRAFLTALGIIIGVASVVAVVSMIQGFKHSIEEQFQGLGANNISVSAYTPPMDELKGLRAKLSEQDVFHLSRGVDGIDRVTPVLEIVTDTSYRGKTHSTWVRGTTPGYLFVNATGLDRGRFLTEADNKSRRNVCVIGTKLAEKLNLPSDPLGTYFQISGEWFKVVGVMEKKGETFGFSMDDFVLVPYSKSSSLMDDPTQADITVQLSMQEGYLAADVKNSVSKMLRNLHDLEEGEPDDFRIETQQEITKTFSQLMNGITLIIGGVVAISLLVGGIGIMNIMLVSVTERTKEIGIRKALGAKRLHILMQFLIESILISFSAGVLGLLIGMGVSQVVSLTVPQLAGAHTPYWAMLLAFAFSVGTGVLFGILPAIKASGLDPIQSLQYE